METEVIMDEVIQLGERPEIHGLILRHFRGERDYDMIVDVINTSQAEDGVQEVVIREEVVHSLQPRDNWDPAADMLLVEVDGQLVGLSEVEWRKNLEGDWLGWHHASLVPGWRRKGIGTIMLAWNEQRLSEIAPSMTDDPAGKHYFQVFCPEQATGRNLLLEKAGYEAVRYFYLMLHDDLQKLPAAVPPAGVSIRTAKAEDRRAIWEAKEQAFRDHWGYIPKNEEDYLSWLGDPYQDLDLWQIAWHRDGSGEEQVVGLVLNFIYPGDNARYGLMRGYAESLGVLRPWRGCGLGRALLVRSLDVLRERGMTEAALRVDTDNLSGALRLYEGVGFRAISRDVIYRKPMK
jgi:mycothiol synthase